MTLDRVVGALRGSSLGQIVLYGADREILFSTVNTSTDALSLSQPVQEQATAGGNLVPVQSISVEQTPDQVAYIPFVVDSVPLGVVGVLQANNIWYATDASRAMLALFLSLSAGLVLICLFLAGRLAGAR